MFRQARLDAPGKLHHVMIRGIEGKSIFRNSQGQEYGISLTEIARSLEVCTSAIAKKSQWGQAQWGQAIVIRYFFLLFSFRFISMILPFLEKSFFRCIKMGSVKMGDRIHNSLCLSSLSILFSSSDPRPQILDKLVVWVIIIIEDTYL